MSSLWTPSGEHTPEEPEPATAAPPAGDGPEPSAEELAAIREMHTQLRAAPVEDVVANHAAGLMQLALIHLGVATPLDDAGTPLAPDLAKAGVAVDGFAAIVEGLGPRLGSHEGPMREALAQLQNAYVQVSEAIE